MWNQQHRIRHIVQIAAATFALAALGTASSVRAAEPLACTTSSAFPDGKGSGRWTISGSEPYKVPCLDGTECTGMTYLVTVNSGQLPDHVVVNVPADVVVEDPGPAYVFGTCDKEPRTSVGGACHMQTVRLSVGGSKEFFELIVRGRRVSVPSTVYVQKARTLESCRIASLGAEGPLDPFQSVAELTTIAFKDCRVSIPKSTDDGTPGTAFFAEGSDPDCAFVANGEPIENLSLQVNGQAVGLTRFSTDFEAGSGEGSCSTQVIRGRVYSFCTCADTNNDGLPDDPRPPCR